MASRRPITQREILNPDRILSNVLKDYVEGNLDDYNFLFRALVVEIDQVGGALAGPGTPNETEPPNPPNSIKARIVSDGRDSHLTDDELDIFWPLFPYDVMPLKEGEHVYVIYEDTNEKNHGLWISRIPEPSAIDDRNITPGSKKYEQDTRNQDAVSAVGLQKAAQDSESNPSDPQPSAEFTPEQNIPKFRARIGDRVVEASNNTIIVLGRDRPSDPNSGEKTEAGTIDIVAGRSGPDNMDMSGDKSRIYISMKTDIDGNLGISVGSASGPVAAIGLKSDEIRIVARSGMKLVVENGNVHVDGKEILLGKGAKDETLILGKSFMTELSKFLDSLIPFSAPTGAAFNIPSTVALPTVASAAVQFKAKLQQLLSKKSKTE